MASTAEALGKENYAVDTARGSLAKMFKEGKDLIDTQKSDNLFQQLESRSLTTDEEKIIQERVNLQRRMLAAFEKQETARKVEEIRSVHKAVTEEEAQKALELCAGREEEAAARLAEPDFLRRVTAACKGVVNVSEPAQIKRRPRAAKSSRRLENGEAGNQVFVGSFRGRGYPSQSVQKPEAAAKRQKVGGHTCETIPEDDVGKAELTAPEAPEDGPPQSPEHKQKEEEEVLHSPAGPGGTEAPQRYLLAKELSNGSIRPATTSEVQGLHVPESAMGKQPCRLPTPPSISSTKPKEVKKEETGAGIDVNSSTIKGAVRLLAGQPQEKALKFLQKMPPAVAEKALELLKAQDAEKADVLSAELQGACQVAEKPGEAAPESAASLDTCAKTRGGARPRRAKPVVQAISSSDEAEEDSDTTETTEEEAEDGSSDEEEYTAKQRRSTRRQEPGVKQRPPRAAKSKAIQVLAGSEDEEPEVREKSPACPLPTPSEEQQKGPAKQQRLRTGLKSHPKSKAVLLAEEQLENGDHTKESSPAVDQPAVQEPAAKAGKISEPESKEEQAVEPASEEVAEGGAEDPAGGRSGKKARKQAISVRGHTNRGRVRQKSHKSAELVEVGCLRAQQGWYNAGYIFPEGFKSRVNFRSSVELDQLCVHECTVLARGGQFWPLPTFSVVAMDRPEEPLVAKSCTGCWTGVLKRINAEIEARRRAGEKLPPPPKTAIAGPEYFGFNQAEVQDAIELLDAEHKCAEYWQGKAERTAHAAGLPPDPAARPARPRAGGSKPRRKRNRGDSSEDDEGAMEGDDDDDETALMSNKWSAVSRHERYRKRYGKEGEPEFVDADNPLPGWIDPITLEPVASPAISPWGHVMGMATWKAILSSSGKCPFTQRSLSWEQCQLLTTHNIERFKQRIVADDDVLKKFGLR